VFDKPLSNAVLHKTAPDIIKLQPESKPIQTKFRKFAPWETNVLKTQIPVLLEQGVIAKSSSPWRHAPVIVPKKSGGHRIAINYKPVNSVTIADAFPLPRVDEMLEQLAGSQVFSSLDFTQCY